MMTIGDHHPGTLCYKTPNTVAQSINQSPTLHFLQRVVCHLCYDALVYEHVGRASGREETRWILSQWWIKRLLSCASGAA
jgi:hypothetical protein